MTKRIKYYTPALCWGFLIAYFTGVPSERLPVSLGLFNDKLIHFGIFFLLTALIILGKVRYKLEGSVTAVQALLIFALCASFGGLIEIYQANYLNSRHGDWADFLANNIGIVAALSIWWCRKYWLAKG